MRSIILAALPLALPLALSFALSGSAMAGGPSLPIDDPQVCAACHGQVVAEWQQSMHSRAHADQDPLFAAMRSLRMDKQGAEVADKCAQCHTPRSPQAPDAAAGRVGVSCAACHTVTAVDPSQPARGAARLTFGDGSVLYGPHDLAENASPVHGTGPAPAHLTDGRTLCLACHGEMKNPKGAPTCTTGVELADHGEDASCTSCHMPQVDGPTGAGVVPRETHASHAFLGPHRAWLQDDTSFLAQAVAIEAVIEGDALVVTLVNQSGHAFPTGFPGRMAVVVASGTSAGGDTVWSVPGKSPMKDHPEAVLNKVYVDAEGAPILPPFADKLARDNRLKPAETRTLRFSLPSEVVSVDLKLVYHLLPPPAVAALGVQDTAEAVPKVVKQLTVSR